MPYKGSPQALQDVVGGQVPITFDQLTAGLQLAKAGKLKLLAVTTPKRTSLAPDTPTMIESGVKGFEIVSWQAIYAPKGTPQPIVQRLNAEIVKILKTPDIRDKLAAQMGMEVVGSSPAGTDGADATRDPALGGAGEEVRRNAQLTEGAHIMELKPDTIARLRQVSTATLCTAALQARLPQRLHPGRSRG